MSLISETADAMMADQQVDEDGRRTPARRARKQRKSGWEKRQANPSSAGLFTFRRTNEKHAAGATAGAERGEAPEYKSYAGRAAFSIARALLALLHGRRFGEAAALVPALIQSFGRIPEPVYLLAFEVMRALPGRTLQASLFLRRLAAVDVVRAERLTLMLACHQLETGRTGDARHSLAELWMSRGTDTCGGGAIALSALLSFQTARASELGRAHGRVAEGEGEALAGEMRWDLPTVHFAAAADDATVDAAVGDALRALDSARAAGVETSGLALCNALLRAHVAGRPEEAVATLREYAHAHDGDLGAALAFLFAANEALDATKKRKRAAGQTATEADARASAASALLDAAQCALAADPACAVAHAALADAADAWRQSAPAGSPPLLEAHDALHWGAARAEHAPNDCEAWAALGKLLARAARAAPAAASRGLPVALVGAEWADRLDWWPRTYFRPAAARALARGGGAAADVALAQKVAVCALLYGGALPYVQWVLYAHGRLADTDGSDRATACRAALKRLQKLRISVSELEDVSALATFAAEDALELARAKGALAQLRWPAFSAHVAGAHPALARALDDPASEASRAARAEAAHWLERNAEVAPALASG
jgi:hypothetical protein